MFPGFATRDSSDGGLANIEVSGEFALGDALGKPQPYGSNVGCAQFCTSMPLTYRLNYWNKRDKSVEVCPCNAVNHAVDGELRGPKHALKITLLHSHERRESDIQDIALCKARSSRRLTASLSGFGNLIHHIVAVCSDKEMFDTNAPRSVTMMAHAQAVTDISIGNDPGDSVRSRLNRVCGSADPRKVNDPVSVSVYSPSPYKASVHIDRLPVEAGHERFLLYGNPDSIVKQHVGLLVAIVLGAGAGNHARSGAAILPTEDVQWQH